jgi:hypothetical protein
VLLVLVVLTLIGGFAWPALQGTLQHNRLTRAADQIRAEWGSARLEAMSSGNIIAFRYELGGPQFRIDPLYAAASAQAGTGGQAAGTELHESAGDLLQGRSVAGTLPEDVMFNSTDQVVDERVLAVAQAQTLQSVQPTSGGTWSPPILFYPDGSTSDAYLTLVNVSDLCVVLSLRGVTGTARTSPLVPRSELAL